MFKSKYIDNLNMSLTSSMSGGNPCAVSSAAAAAAQPNVNAPFTMLPQMASPAYHANLPGPVAARFAQPIDLGGKLSDVVQFPGHLGEFAPPLRT